MPDSYDQGDANPAAVGPLTRAIILAQPITLMGGRVGPGASDKALRALIDAVRNLEDRLIAAGL
jgi:hypothetical protein